MQFFKSLNPFNLCIGTNNNGTKNTTNKTQKNPNTNFNNNENKEKINDNDKNIVQTDNSRQKGSILDKIENEINHDRYNNGRTSELNLQQNKNELSHNTSNFQNSFNTVNKIINDNVAHQSNDELTKISDDASSNLQTPNPNPISNVSNVRNVVNVTDTSEISLGEERIRKWLAKSKHDKIIND